LRYTQPARSSANCNPSTLLDGIIQKKPDLLDPFLCSADEFVGILDQYVLNHSFLSHHVLNSFAMGTFTDPVQSQPSAPTHDNEGRQLYGTIRALVIWMDAYKMFTKDFGVYLQSTIKLMSSLPNSKEYVEVLEENRDEEMGKYDEETMETIEALGLDAKALENVPHGQLYTITRNKLVKVRDSLQKKDVINAHDPSQEQLEFAARPMVDAFFKACRATSGSSASAESALSAMYFGSELLVSTMYGQLVGYLRAMASSPDVTSISLDDLAFFLLHIDLDVEHAEHMRESAVALAQTKESRLIMMETVQQVMEARVQLLDRFVEVAFPPTGHGGEASAKLYNKQSQNWVRKGKSCLSDFTGRPKIFEFCSDHVKDSYVLDVGCGEGYGARKMVEMGAKKVVGFDVSSEMIEKANSNPQKSGRETYRVCDATKLVKEVERTPAALGIVPGRMLDEGCFDLSIAIFLFNYTSIHDMKQIMSQIFSLLRPGGRFIFSVPHPFMLNAHTDDPKSAFSFIKGNGVVPSSYFSLRDRKFSGVIKTIDGRGLNVKMCFKTLSDYLDSMADCGFEMAKMHEARVLKEHVELQPDFFASVKDSPLHCIFEAIKPLDHKWGAARIPQAIRWTSLERARPLSTVEVVIPKTASEELFLLSLELVKSGHDENSYSPSSQDLKRLPNTHTFAQDLSKRLRSTPGVVYMPEAIDMARLRSCGNEEFAVSQAKMIYFLLSSLIGTVDGSARGNLFDVKDKGLDATQADNVLFSVSSAEATWHTDGASADKSYHIVGLFCIDAATKGGTFRASNAASAIQTLIHRAPKFLQYELFRPIPRDLLENGAGQGVGRDLLSFSRGDELLMKRIRHNSYPIAEISSSPTCQNIGGVRFRYMRQWIESGHQKGHVQTSPLLTMAMDALDHELDQEKLISKKLESGDIIFGNNYSIAHARDAFNSKTDRPRHMVRVWIQ